MALQGNLDDFNILNILQMVKLEGKTGRLTLTEGDDIVKVTFDGGSIIYAEGSSARDEKRIAGTLLSNRLMDKSGWEQVKKEHENSLRPYWELLSKNLSLDILVELLKRQIIDTVYYALRWKKGNYEFTQLKSLKYNSKIMTPMDVDALLMEGCRIADEWSGLKSSIPPFKTYVTKNIIGEEDDESLKEKAAHDSVEDFRLSLEYDILSARGVELSSYEVAVLSVVGEGKTIGDILDSARQGQYETLEAVKKLLTKSVIKPTKKRVEKKSASKKGNLSNVVAVIILLALVVGGFAGQIMSFPDALKSRKNGMVEVNKIKTEGELKKLERALRVYMALNGHPPENLQDLISEGILDSVDLLDPWNNPYKLEYGSESFALYSNGPDKFLLTDNIYL